jgi:hypothetical protein
VWNALAIPTTLMYVAVMDPRYVVLYSPDNVTVGPGERWPDIVVAQTGFQGAAEVYWNRSLSYRSSHNPDHSVRAAACVPLWRRGVSCSALERVCRRRR